LPDAELQRVIALTQSDRPTPGLGRDWVACLDTAVAQAGSAARRIECRSWTAQGVTSTLVALREGDVVVPVVESALAGGEGEGRIILEVVGGTGGEIFHSQEAITPELIERIRAAHGGKLPFVLMEQSAYFPLLERGFTVASVGYWGTNLRTLDEAGEFALGARDVRIAFDHYAAAQGREPALLTESMGNHIALAALGEGRIETLDALALVPVMDGLRSHLARAQRERERAVAKGRKYGKWTNFNIFSRSGEAIVFDRSGFHPVHDHVPKYVGDADYPWRGVDLSGACSRLVLATKDPRTKDYLASTKRLPGFVTVLDSGHDIVADARDETRAIFAEFALCLTREAASA
jgi:hypothetical protein